MYRRAFVLAFALAGIATPVLAQRDSVPSAPGVNVVPGDTARSSRGVEAAAGAVAATPVAVTRRSSATAPAPALQSRMGLGQARAMMIVGAGALLAGAIIDGDAGTIIMVGGALVGLYGLYKYLQ